MQKSKILVVEDDFVLQEIICLTLCDYFIIERASSGEEALEILEKYSPDIILSDIMMAGMSGYDLCEKIRASNKLKFVKFIFLSGNAKTEERVKGYKVGGDDYIVKPYNNAELIAKLNVYSKLKNTEELDNTYMFSGYHFQQKNRKY